ncbi:hypothetical protein GCM10007028_26800 [Algibacter mikhailovii]|uniref:GH16 domain-containing protein n=2 Tax=Algibacter mikhailovii TaxID=425498 RepID=A0A918R9H4_9FLAO|nr:hypothetical protein GCM10007028_26800 [Algibacter mikhailovii]
MSSCQDNESEVVAEIKETLEQIEYVPEDYHLVLTDDFNTFSSQNWSKGLTHDEDPSIKMIWNKNKGGRNLLNDNYAGYLIDDNVYINQGYLYLENRKETIQGADPDRTFEYSTGWINSLQKINFNGSRKGVYIEVKAKFPKGDKVWPAIWLIDDSLSRAWPPEVDIWEYFGKFFNTTKKDQMYMRFIYGKWNDKHDHSVPINNFQKNYKASEDWHIYGYQWTKTSMKWFIDGQLLHTKTKGVDVLAQDWPDKTMCLVINNGLLNVVNEGNTVFPNALVLDYLKVFEYKE